MRCAAPVTYFVFADGSSGTRLQISALQIGPDVAACLPGELALLSYAELGNVTANPFRLDLAEAGAIGTAVILIWALAWGFRMLIRSLNAGPESSEI